MKALRAFLLAFAILAAAASLPLLVGGCDYVRLLRPSVLKQLNPDVVRLVNELPAVDDPNKAIVALLFAHELQASSAGRTKS